MLQARAAAPAWRLATPIVIVGEGPFEKEAETVADAKKRGMGWRVVASSEELETGVVV